MEDTIRIAVAENRKIQSQKMLRQMMQNDKNGRSPHLRISQDSESLHKKPHCYAVNVTVNKFMVRINTERKEHHSDSSHRTKYNIKTRRDMKQNETTQLCLYHQECFRSMSHINHVLENYRYDVLVTSCFSVSIYEGGWQGHSVTACTSQC